MWRFAVLGAALLAGAPVYAAAQAPEAAPQSPVEESVAARADVADPAERLNRASYAVGSVLDRAALAPLARGYRAVTPGFVRAGVRNALSNLDAPKTFANDLLQAEWKRAGKTAVRFVMNTTLGVGGLIDVGRGVGLQGHSEDFGQTLGKWGVKPGAYVYNPIGGPSSVRDTVGTVVDIAFNPLAYARGHDINAIRGGRAAVGAIAAREGVLDQSDALNRTSTDPYVSLRTIYAQARASAIRNGRDNVEELPDFEASTP